MDRQASGSHKMSRRSAATTISDHLRILTPRLPSTPKNESTDLDMSAMLRFIVSLVWFFVDFDQQGQQCENKKPTSSSSSSSSGRSLKFQEWVEERPPRSFLAEVGIVVWVMSLGEVSSRHLPFPLDDDYSLSTGLTRKHAWICATGEIL